MEIILTLGTTDEPKEFKVDLPDGIFATYMGVELVVPVDEDNPTGRLTITRISFRGE